MHKKLFYGIKGPFFSGSNGLIWLEVVVGGTLATSSFFLNGKSSPFLKVSSTLLISWRIETVWPEITHFDQMKKLEYAFFFLSAWPAPLPVCTSICLNTSSLPVYLSTFLSACISVCLLACLPISICMIIWLSACLPKVYLTLEFQTNNEKPHKVLKWQPSKWWTTYCV